MLILNRFGVRHCLAEIMIQIPENGRIIVNLAWFHRIYKNIDYINRIRPRRGFIPAETLVHNDTAGDNGNAGGTLNHPKLGFKTRTFGDILCRNQDIVEYV